MGSNLNVVMLMVTQNYDAFGSIMPYNANAGGVTILGAFGSGIITASFVYYQNLQENEAYIGEASSHETGHMFGLSHLSCFVSFLNDLRILFSLILDPYFV